MSYSHQAKARFQVTSWDESVITDIDDEGTTMGDLYFPNRGVTRATVGYTYSGDIEGTSTVTYLIGYHAGRAPVLGFERFEGSVAGHEGSCVLRQVGSQDSGSVSAHVEVVTPMGTGGLEALRGEADLRIAGHSDDGYELVLSYDLG